MRLYRSPKKILADLRFVSDGFVIFSISATAQVVSDGQASTVSLTVPSGAPLRLYLTGRVSKGLGAPGQAKLMEPSLPLTGR